MAPLFAHSLRLSASTGFRYSGRCQIITKLVFCVFKPLHICHPYVKTLSFRRNGTAPHLSLITRKVKPKAKNAVRSLYNNFKKMSVNICMQKLFETAGLEELDKKEFAVLGGGHIGHDIKGLWRSFYIGTNVYEKTILGVGVFLTVLGKGRPIEGARIIGRCAQSLLKDLEFVGVEQINYTRVNQTQGDSA